MVCDIRHLLANMVFTELKMCTGIEKMHPTCTQCFSLGLPTIVNSVCPVWMQGHVRHVQYFDFSLTPLNEHRILHRASPYIDFMCADECLRESHKANVVRIQVELYLTVYEMVHRLMRHQDQVYFCHVPSSEDIIPNFSHLVTLAKQCIEEDLVWIGDDTSKCGLSSFLITSTGVNRLRSQMPRIMSQPMCKLMKDIFGEVGRVSSLSPVHTVTAQLQLSAAPTLYHVPSIANVNFTGTGYLPDVVVIVGAASHTVVLQVLERLPSSPTPMVIVCEPVHARHDQIAAEILFGGGVLAQIHTNVQLSRYAIVSRRCDNACKHLFVADGMSSRLGLPVYSLAPVTACLKMAATPVITRSIQGLLSEYGTFRSPVVFVCAPDICDAVVDGTPSTGVIVHVDAHAVQTNEFSL